MRFMSFKHKASWGSRVKTRTGDGSKRIASARVRGDPAWDGPTIVDNDGKLVICYVSKADGTILPVLFRHCGDIASLRYVTSRTPTIIMASHLSTFRWGIISTGNIATKFVQVLFLWPLGTCGSPISLTGPSGRSKNVHPLPH